MVFTQGFIVLYLEKMAKKLPFGRCWMGKKKTDAIIVIDGSSFLYRAYYGLRPLHTSKGIAVQATYGFCRSIKKLIDDFDSDKMVLVWDSPGKTFRNDIYEDYKATRQPPPSDIWLQKEQIQEFAGNIGLFQLAKPGDEADDLIASIAKERSGQKVIVVTPDKDLHQLIDENVTIFDPFKNEFIDEKSFEDKKGFSPERLMLYHALLGDASDNIPGVKGIGAKTATTLVIQFKTLDNLYNNLDDVAKDRTRNLLRDQEDSARLSLDLFTLRTYKLNISDKKLAFDKNQWWNAYSLFEKFEFKSFLRDAPENIKNPVVQKIEQQLSLIGAPDDVAMLPRKEVKAGWKCEVVITKEALDKLVVFLEKKKFFALDTETTGLRPHLDRLVGISFAADKRKAFYVPVSHEEGGQLEKEYVIEKLRPILEGSSVKKTFHNAKFDRHIMWQCGIEIGGCDFDSLIAASLLRKEWQKIGLKFMSQYCFDEPMKSCSDLMGKKKTFAEVSIQDGATYSCHDSLQTYKLKMHLEKELRGEKKLKSLFYNIEMPLNEVLIRMERIGIKLDPKVLGEIERDIDKELEVIEKKMQAYVATKQSKKLNLNSPKQIEELLFDVLDLSPVKKSKEGRRSTDQEVLERLAESHPIPGIILRYRELFKLKSTYVLPLPKQVNPKTGRIHTTFNQTGVTTGRLASAVPNLQNIPAAQGYGHKIRSSFVAEKGNLFLSADYSQIELRVLAHLSKDKNLIKAFLEDRDIHIETAAHIFDISPGKVEKKQRDVGKRINFSIMYGLTPYGLSRDLRIKPSEAKEYIDTYLEQYPGVAKWFNDVVEKGKEKGYVETWYGRRRYLAGLLENNKTLYETARRAALNTPVQGTASEVMKLAMIEMEKVFKKENFKARMILQVHDEIIIELPLEEKEMVSESVKKCMEGVVSWRIPLKVEVRIGKNWGEITK